MKLKNLEISNFKGVKTFVLEPDGKNVSVYGINASGKSSIFDGFCWLLFGKDSIGQANFEIKPLDKNGQVVPALESIVSATLTDGKNEVAFKKVYSEKYTKKKGTAKSVFTGHTINHFVNSVPVKKKEFDAAINNICDESAFKLLTNPREFNSIHWTERRKLLLDIVGDICHEDIIESNADLSPLFDILGNHGIDDQRKILAARRAEINKELKKIPVRIDEATGSAVDVELGKTEITARVRDLKLRKKDKEKELVTLRTGGGIVESEKALARFETKIINHKNKKAEASSGILLKQQKELSDLEIESVKAAAATEKAVVLQFSLQDEKKELTNKVPELVKEQARLRKKWFETDKKEFKPDSSSNACPACGQKLQAEKIAEATRLATEEFNEAKAAELADIQEQGKAIKYGINTIESSIKDIDKRLKSSDSVIQALKKVQDTAETAMDNCTSHHIKQNTEVLADPEMDRMIIMKNDISERINELVKGSYDAIVTVSDEIERFDKLIEILNKDLLHLDANKRIVKRVSELKDQERCLASEFENLESDLFVIETFIRTKVQMLEERINKKFKVARFKLFSENINESVTEVCEVTVDGVPYSSLNSGMRTNIGLDIINTLSDHFGIRLPIFLDSAESVSSFFKTESQQIKLIVSAKDKVLRITND